MPTRKTSEHPSNTCGGTNARSKRSVSHEIQAPVKNSGLKRLRRTRGQIDGIMKMIDGNRHCSDILEQLAAAQQGLRAVGREIMRDHLRWCAEATRDLNSEEAGRVYDALIDLIYKNA